ncbi:laminin subunit alpha-1-like [Photinus pyralis]|nr:laminin subunit alpha-1-like [Photinus pyralis]
MHVRFTVFWCYVAAELQGLKYLLQGIGQNYKSDSQTLENGGLWPSVFNLATKASVSANATCGEVGREEFCRLAENGRGKCGYCDQLGQDTTKQHSVQNVIDGSNRWWQSPALSNGPEFEYVTITFDLKQVYQVAYVTLKAANSPRPGSWILERSIDGMDYKAWQYYARNDKECFERYGISPTKGKPHFYTDSEVICTSYYSKLAPFENGEVHAFLVQGRPGANESSPELLEFTKARFVRLKFQGFKAAVEPTPKWLSQDNFRDKRLFYSIRDISIGGQCVCNGHAANCRHNVASGHPECECSHHTCGPNCERCCPLYNQKQWGPGSSRDARKCIPCNCHGHSVSCHYDEEVDKAGLSLDADGNYQGGGVCDNCTDFTTGVNCERCVQGYYRPTSVSPDARTPCFKCECDKYGSVGTCEPGGESAGRCECRKGYAGTTCNECAPGYRGYPNCELCPCDPRGTIQHHDCENDCVCKPFADGKHCDNCKTGHFALRYDNREGCASCYCSGVTTLCESAIIQPKKLESAEEWKVTDIALNKVVTPTWDPDIRTWIIGNYEIPDVEAFYWLAPEDYLGNKLESYGSYFSFKVQWIVMRGDTSGKPTAGPNIILVGNNGMKIGFGEEQYVGKDMEFRIKLQEYDWYHVPSDVKDIITRLRRTEYKGDPVSRFQFLSVLTDIKYILLRATFHTDQIEGMLEGAVLETGIMGENEDYSAVERCSCPSGYTGLSCESCDYGYVRIVTNTTTHQEQGFCVKCDCNGHSRTCNPDTGQCFCEHNTVGEKCERCSPGFYGNPLGGTAADCKRCACPLLEPDNNFSPSCQLDFFPEVSEDVGSYVCTQCPQGYTGDHCELCDDGYFGNPYEVGNKCEPCSCGGGPCDRTTGQCLGCPGNTEGWRCEKCKKDYFGDPLNANCQACLCDSFGSISPECDNKTGQCLCKPHFIGRTCDTCEAGFGNVTATCTQCNCNEIGSKSLTCNSYTGICDCKSGVEGFRCDACQYLHYGFGDNGCESK